MVVEAALRQLQNSLCQCELLAGKLEWPPLCQWMAEDGVEWLGEGRMGREWTEWGEGKEEDPGVDKQQQQQQHMPSWV